MWFAGSTGAGLWRSVDNGGTWSQVLNGGFPFWENQFNSIIINPTTKIIYAGYSKIGGGNGGVISSSDNGVSWNVVGSNSLNTAVFSLALSNNSLFAGTKNGVYRSTDGASWTQVNFNNTEIRSVAVSGTSLFAATKDGVYRSVNDGVNWIQINSGLTDKDVLSLAISGTNLLAGTNDRSVWLTTIDNTAPTVIAFVPANGGNEKVPVASNLEITFNKAVQVSNSGTISIYNGSMLIEEINLATQASRLTGVGTTKITIDPVNDFPLAANISIRISAGAITDLFGNPYAGITNSTTWAFEVVDDNTPPTLDISQNPKETDGSQGGTLSAVADDNIGIKEVLFRYRAITDGGDFTAPVAATITTTAKTYRATIPAAKLQDKLGIEYEFIATDAAGNATRKSEVIRRAYPQGLPIPFARYGNTHDKYELIAIPLDLGTTNKVSNVFEEVGNPDKKKWRLVEFRANSQSAFTDLTANSTLEAKKGYWMIVKDSPGKPITTGAAKAVVAAPAPVKVALNGTAGFQLIGNPYPFDISWAEIEKANPGIKSKIKAFHVMENGAYQDIISKPTIPLRQFRGAVLELHSLQTGAPTELTFPVKMDRTINPNGRIAQGRTPVEEGWLTYLTLTDGDRQYDLSGFGMQQKADAGLDIYDRLVPPYLGEPFDLKFATPTQIDFPMTQDVVAPATQHTWELIAEASTSKPYVELSWEYLPADGQGLWLYDRDGQNLIDMRSQHSYRYSTSYSKRFSIFYGSKEKLTEALGLSNPVLMAIHPNPFRERTQIPFSIPASNTRHRVDVEIYQLSGERVALLANGEFPAGVHTITWEGKDASGKQLPAGLYLCRFTVQTAGQTSSYSRKLIIK
jgi:hypothetical protein